MKYRYGLIILAGLGLLALFFFRESVLYKVGTYLVVDQVAGRVDVAVTPAIKEKVVQCYQAGGCRKVLVVVFTSGRTWKKAGTKLNAEQEVREQGAQAGINSDDLIVITRPRDDAQYFGSLKKLFIDEDLHSAVFYVGYHRGRRYRFYLDRYFDGVATYVQTINSNTDYMRNFDRWWENTILDNLFIDEYLRMFFYYFNKALLTEPVSPT